MERSLAASLPSRLSTRVANGTRWAVIGHWSALGAVHPEVGCDRPVPRCKYTVHLVVLGTVCQPHLPISFPPATWFYAELICQRIYFLAPALVSISLFFLLLGGAALACGSPQQM